MKPLPKGLLLLLVTSLVAGEEELAPVIKTLSGEISGIKEESTHGTPFYSYYSIPYAQPPLEHLRFKNPVEIDSWNGLRKGSELPPMCPQYESGTVMMPKLTGNEDCLFLNIFTPSPKEERLRLPVMIFIHGGGYFRGSSRDYLPHVMMNEKMVFVTIQYRLGMLGFLSTEDAEAPGNLGLKDQTMALTWVQNNVHLFGGDPIKITLLGNSAGASSVHWQILSPRSIGLFQRAILMSGSVFCPFATGGAYKDVAEYTAKFFNCTTDDGSKTLISCLQKLPANDLVPLQQHFTVWYINPFLFAPRIDGDFIPAEPEVLLKEGRQKRLDLMTGITSHEGALYSIPIYANEAYRAAIMLNFPEYGPMSLEFSDGDFSPLNQTIKIFDYYLKGVNIDTDNADNLTRMFSDRYFNLPHDLTSVLHAKNVQRFKKKVFRYEVTHRGQRSVNDVYGLPFGKHYVSHTDDLFYLFSGGRKFHPLENEEDLKLRDIMTKMWYNFAETGDPTPDDDLGFKWEPMNGDGRMRHLNLNPTPTMEDDSRTKVREFWDSLPLKHNLLLHPERVANLSAIPLDELEKAKHIAPDGEVPEGSEDPKIIESKEEESNKKSENLKSAKNSKDKDKTRSTTKEEIYHSEDPVKETNKKEEL